MRILLITEYYPPRVFGGGEISAKSLAEALADAGDSVTVLTSGLGTDEKEGKVRVLRLLDSAAGVSGLREQWRRSVTFTRSVRRILPRILRECGPFDLVHCPNPTTGVIVRAAGPLLRKAKLPFLCTINGYGTFCPKGNMFYKEREPCTGHGMLKCVGCIAASTTIGKTHVPASLRYNPLWWAATYAFFRWRLRGARYVTHWIPYTNAMLPLIRHCRIASPAIPIPNVVQPFPKGNDAAIAAKEKALRALADHRTLIAGIGALEPVKGFDLLISAIAESHVKDLFLLIVGDGSLKEDLLSLARARGIAEHVHIESVPHELMPAVYRAANIIALPSKYPEPLSRVCSEAAYFGKPLLATDAGGNTACVMHGKTGWLVPPTVESWASTIRSIAALAGPDSDENDPLGAMGAATKKFYAERFAPQGVVLRIRELYANAAKKRDINP